ncbi:hypothetical protein STENM327S_00009 [Streptomyces tendae]
MTAPVVHSLREQIREHILEGIISGRWQPGERIVERRIATELEVSQTPVREALRELESLRLIESAPNKGVRVRNLTAADLERLPRPGRPGGDRGRTGGGPARPGLLGPGAARRRAVRGRPGLRRHRPGAAHGGLPP